MERRLLLESTTNTRDVGGLPTAAGGWMRRGVLFRTDAVLAPTAADRELLAGLGLRHAIDFRSLPEVESLGGNQFGDGVQVRVLPLVDEGTAVLGEAMIRALRDRDVALAVETLGDGRARELGLLGPTNLVRSVTVRSAFAEVLRLIASDDGAPLIFNCTAGKDRTGVFAALVQRLVGVADEVIVDDYLLSNTLRADHNAMSYQHLSAAGLDVELVRPLLEQQPEAITSMFAAIDDDYGDFETYLLEGLSVEREVLADVRAKLLDD